MSIAAPQYVQPVIIVWAICIIALLGVALVTTPSNRNSLNAPGRKWAINIASVVLIGLLAYCAYISW